MTEAVVSGDEPLRLDVHWRVEERRSGGATVHPLRVVEGTSRPVGTDIDQLRALVAEIVREEVRADLGRRMTGSIRGLVRDEVNCILAKLGAH